MQSVKQHLSGILYCPYLLAGNVKTVTTNFQMRLDFMTFVISGPATTSTSIAHLLGGEIIGVANGDAVSEATQCLTDLFYVRNQVNLPHICGTMSGEHGLLNWRVFFKWIYNLVSLFATVYFEASDSCNDLDFQFGASGVGLTAVATRSFSIKVQWIGEDILWITFVDSFHLSIGDTIWLQLWESGTHRLWSVFFWFRSHWIRSIF